MEDIGVISIVRQRSKKDSRVNGSEVTAVSHESNQDIKSASDKLDIEACIYKLLTTNMSRGLHRDLNVVPVLVRVESWRH